MKDLAITLRPRKLSEIFNQNSIVNELQTRATSKKWPTAMLFKGPSGTGKSTAAQIVAMTINCTHLDSEGNPCGKCASCKSIINEKFDRDTLVLDGSTIGVKDDVISFGNLADMSPMMDKNRVLIIEESDQLSTAAKNALHKILEKPRDHVHFILLSMYNSGLPVSIQSRCQTFNFKSFGLKDVALGLHTIMKNLNLWTDETIPDSFKTEGLLTLASASKGSFREAIQYLEKCLVGKYYTKDEIRKNLGIIDNSTVNDLLSRLLNMDTSFFELYNTIDYMEFFNLGYYTLTQAYMYNISGYIENEWYEDIIKGISRHEKLKPVVSLFDELYKESKPYLKKEFVLSRILNFFSLKTSLIREDKNPAQDVSSFQARQALLDAEARARIISTKNDVEHTPLGPRATRVPRGM